jgi:hypothetical protein
MNRRKKFALTLLLLLLLSQAPFVYRRYRLGQLRRTIAELETKRAATSQDEFTEYKGVIHVHSYLGGHSEGSFDEIINAARANSLDFVIMTEHPSADVDTAAATLNGLHENTLFVNGSEVVAAGGERLLVVPGLSDNSSKSTAKELIASAKASGKLVFVAYPEKVPDWTALQGHDGVEIYNLFTNAQRINYPLLAFDCLWSCGSYADLLFTTFYERPSENLIRWDAALANQDQQKVAIAGNDAHSNVGFRFPQKEPILEFKLDPYERSFRVVRNHVILARGEELNPATLLKALKRGHSFIAFDLFSDATGFRFVAETASERRMLGDDIALPSRGEVRLAVEAPLTSRVVFFRNGKQIDEAHETRRKTLAVDQKGVYRVEVYLKELEPLIGASPWIISNPIYVR